MMNIFGAIKANGGKILKGALIVGGGIAGLLLVGSFISKKDTNEEEVCENVEETNEESDDEDSDEE
jgi:hypothetical protein